MLNDIFRALRCIKTFSSYVVADFIVKGTCEEVVDTEEEILESSSRAALMDPKVTSQGHLHDTADTTQSTADLTAFVQNLLQQMQSRFQTMSDSIITKIDEMGNRIDDLEKSIGDLIKEVGVEPGTPQQPNGGPADSSKSSITNS